nr:hypothetical protein [Tanacetum cinerariifolium]
MKVKKVNDQEQIQALVDKKKVIIIEDNIRSDLHFNDVEGTACLLNEAIFEGLTRMGRKQRKEAEVSHNESEDEDHVPTPSSDPLPSGEDSFILNELMRKSRSGGLRRLKNIGLSRRVKSPMEKDSLGAYEDASKQEKMIKEIDQNAEIALDDETQGMINDDEIFGVDDLAGEEVVIETTTTIKDSAAPIIVERRFDEIKELFDREMTKVDENVEPVIDDSKELKKCMEIVPDNGDETKILMKKKILNKKLEDSEDEYQVEGRIVRIKSIQGVTAV